MTRLRLPLVDARGDAELVDEPIYPAEFEPLSPQALLAAPGTLVVVAGLRAGRQRAAAAFVRVLEEAGIRVNRVEASSGMAAHAELVGAVEASAARSEVVVADGNVWLGLYRATLSVLVSGTGTRADRALQRLRGRADVEVDQLSPELVAALASVVARVASARRG